MIVELITVGGWAFWVALILVLLFEVFALSTGADEHSFPTALAVTALLCAVLLTDAFAGARPLWFAGGLAGYLVVGCVWSIYKWREFLIDERKRRRAEWTSSSNSRVSWEEFSKGKRPTGADNKQRIVNWMALWPLSLTWWALTWPRRVFAWLYARLSTLYDRMAERIWAGV